MAGMKLYVGNLSWEASKDDLYDAFAKFGNVEDAFIPTDRETGRSRGFGFVTMDEDAASEAVRELDGSDFLGRTIRVNVAQPQGDRGGRGGGGGGYGGRGGGGYGGGGGGRGRNGGGRGGGGRGYGGGGGGGYGGGGYGGGGY